MLLMATAVTVSFTSATPVLAGTPTAVINTSANEWDAAITGYEAWGIVTSRLRPVLVRVKPGGSPAYRVNPAGTAASLGDIDIGGPSGDVLVFSQGGNDGAGNWDVRLWDLAAKERIPALGVMNTPDRREDDASVSGSKILFARGPVKGLPKCVYLFDFVTRDDPVLIARAPEGGWIDADDIAGDYATYTRCRSNGVCDVYRYRLSTTDRVKIPRSNANRADYWSTVLDDGTVYFVRGSARYCGVDVRIMHWNGVDSSTLATTVFAFPDGIEIGPTNAADGAPPTVYFTRVRCGVPLQTGIWSIAG
jgi:hypothetical protein